MIRTFDLWRNLRVTLLLPQALVAMTKEDRNPGECEAERHLNTSVKARHGSKDHSLHRVDKFAKV